jgi:GDPmannose 4,6-dehydratase
MFACNGILFNQRARLRGETIFVTPKITRAAARISSGAAGRGVPGQPGRPGGTGGTPRTSVRAMWLMLQQPEPEATSSPPPDPFVRESATALPAWADAGRGGEGQDEVGRDAAGGRLRVKIPALFPAHRGGHPPATRARPRQKLGWCPTVDFPDMVARMVAADLKEAEPRPTSARPGLHHLQQLR